jgi:hypothetical protein
MNISGFTPEAMEAISEMLHEDFWENKYAGKCGQKALREQDRQPRTPAQEKADRARAQARRGKSNMSSATRSAAAKKAAETRRQCKG